LFIREMIKRSSAVFQLLELLLSFAFLSLNVFCVCRMQFVRAIV